MKMRPKKRQEFQRIHFFLRQNEKNLAAINQAAMLLYEKSYPLGKALEAYENYLSSRPDSSNAMFNFAWYLARDEQFEKAIQMYRHSLELGIEGPEEAHLNIANIYMDHLQDYERAREELLQAIATNPRYVSAIYNLGNLAEQLGDRDQAEACFEKCLELESGNETALARLADSHRFTKDDDPLLVRMIAVASTSSNSNLHFALGAALNQLENYELAWQYFSSANQLEKNSLPPYDRNHTETWFDQIASQDISQPVTQIQHGSHGPVFICGLFRTGSTLLEQILAAHPRFTPAGESRFFPRLVTKEFHNFPEGLDEITIEELRIWREKHQSYTNRLTAGATRLTDKRLDNFLYVGLIKAIIPSAMFVVTERDWRDVALSIFSTRLGVSQPYSTSLTDIKHYIDLQKRLVEHWESILGNDLVRVKYENLVFEPRATIGRLLNTLGEEWDERCLKFDRLDNPVNTASVWQVREPLHSKSVGRWKNYRKYFVEAFGPEKVGD